MKSNIQLLKHYATGLAVSLLFAALPGNKASAQAWDKPLPLKLQPLATPRSTANWIEFAEGTSLDPATIFTAYKQAFELGDNDEMRLVKIKNDDLGYKHYRYQQYYKNLKVLYAEYLVHQNGSGFVQSANGKLVPGLSLTNIPVFTKEQALQKALDFVGAKKYLWENASMEKELKRMENNPSATYYPQGELLYAPAAPDKMNATDYRLVWHFKIYPDMSAGKVLPKSVYIDATTNQLVSAIDIAMICDGGSGTSAFNGTVGVSTRLVGTNFTSQNDCQTTNIFVYNCNGGEAANNLYLDADNAWTLATQQSAVQAQWGAAQTYSYYIGQHSRTSWNNAAGNMIVYNNSNTASLGPNNACWGCVGNTTIYGTGNTTAATDDWNTNDIMGHEFTHGVTQAEAGLVYSNESGALNESFSDIFGEMVESWSEGNCDYLVGADRGAIRSMSNPPSFSDFAGAMPDTYLGTGWYTGTADNGGVHHNSSVQNFWFYLLSEGGSGTTDFGVPYSVTGITRFKARLIAYRALDLYLTSSSRYIDARAATLRAAFDLYGQCSQEIIAVGDAWHAVGVESQSAQFTRNACGTYSNGEFVQTISQLTAASGCATLVNSATNRVYFTARDRVTLLPGFRAIEGSKFTAYLEPCSSTMWRGSNQDNLIKSDPERGIFPVVTAAAPVAEQPISDALVTVSPNPFTSSFDVFIRARQEGKASVRVFNALGVKVMEQSGISVAKAAAKVTFNATSLVKGIYMVEVFADGVKTVKKIVKM